MAALTPAEQKQVRRTSGMIWSYKTGQMVALQIHLADQMNFFKAMAYELNYEWVTANQVAKHLGLKRRWVMELLRGLTAAKILEYQEGNESVNDGSASDGATDTFRITPVVAEVVANEVDSLSFNAGAFSGGVDPMLADKIIESFHTGVGFTYESRSLLGGEQSAEQTKRMLGVWTKGALVDEVLAVLNNGKVTEALENGGAILDCGCGAGVAVNTLGAAFPNATVHGTDPDGVALGVGRKDAKNANINNVSFFKGFGESYTSDIKYDAVICMDIVHDTPRPDLILQNICKNLLKPGGTLMIKDIKSTGSFKKNLETMGNLPMIYGFSLSMCLASATSTPDGMGLGTTGFNPIVAERMCGEAGFVNFHQHDFRDPANLYYEMQSPGGSTSMTRNATSASMASKKAFKKNSAVRNAIKRSPLYKGKKKKKSKKKRKKYPDLSNNPGPYFCACCAGLNLMQVTCERGSKM